MEVALLEYIRRLTSQKSKRREKIKPYKRMKSLTDFLFGQRGEGNERNLNCLLYHTRPGGWGGRLRRGRWVTWRTREWRVPSEWLNLNACRASTGGFDAIHCFTPPTTRTYQGLEKGGRVVLKFISTGIGAVTPMWRDAENRCIASHTMAFSTLVIQMRGRKV